ncbi:hypothetical protein ONE63_000459 [Megalurothrips usitatus]|uniref:Survival of motor neuron-related-splicing factor 30 n=1 Tax=Megalurothrips usitatus TaxID=439358 RepID=A0AAV7XYH8_9NEOP|nr:hypothetical protein ONE63_000459 [Megalurothrips usitatus]
MAEDLQGNLQNYQLQLQQVEAALLTDPSNEELTKLKTDLEEVIELTNDLIKTQQLESAGSSTEKEVKVSKPSYSEEEPDSPASNKKQWKVGDKCMAIWSEDGQYYEATIEEITNNGEEVSVIFDAYQNADVTNINLLREVSSGSSDPNDKKGKNSSKQREYQKKKKQKKLQRFKQLEEERETEKNKWLAFATKKKGGCLKKSIFASPESVAGRVGIGTCGIGGKEMTKFTSAEKWRKGV